MKTNQKQLIRHRKPHSHTSPNDGKGLSYLFFRKKGFMFLSLRSILMFLSDPARSSVLLCGVNIVSFDNHIPPDRKWFRNSCPIFFPKFLQLIFPSIFKQKLLFLFFPREATASHSNGLPQYNAIQYYKCMTFFNCSTNVTLTFSSL